MFNYFIFVLFSSLPSVIHLANFIYRRTKEKKICELSANWIQIWFFFSLFHRPVDEIYWKSIEQWRLGTLIFDGIVVAWFAFTQQTTNMLSFVLHSHSIQITKPKRHFKTCSVFLSLKWLDGNFLYFAANHSQIYEFGQLCTTMWLVSFGFHWLWMAFLKPKPADAPLRNLQKS